MHQLIRIITTAYDNDDARAIAKSCFDGMHPSLIPPFDYGKMMSEGGRWSETMPDVVQDTGAIEANTDDGMELIEEAWNNQTKAMARKFKLIQEAFDRGVDFEDVLNDARIEDVDVEPWNPLGLAESEEDLAETYIGSIRHEMFGLGRYKGPDIYLYTEFGEGIRKPSRYEDYIDAIESDEGYHTELSDDETWYVVPVDVHY